MKLIPNAQNPKKWEQFYTDMASGNIKMVKRIQRGSGSFRQGRHAKSYTRIQDVVEPTVVTPTEMSVQQAKSEIKHRRQATTTSTKRKHSTPRGQSKSKKPKKKPTKGATRKKPVSKTSSRRGGKTKLPKNDIFSK